MISITCSYVPLRWKSFTNKSIYQQICLCFCSNEQIYIAIESSITLPLELMIFYCIYTLYNNDVKISIEMYDWLLPQ